jgi:ribonuclease-3
VQARLGHRFADPALLVEALTHRSRAVEEGSSLPGNERLEFLGDAVLGLVVAQELLARDPRADEGALSLVRAQAVRKAALAAAARALGVGAWLRLGHGEAASGGRDKDSLLADAFEALLGALYLDGGLEPARAVILRELGALLAGGAPAHGGKDAKTRLQELLQGRGDPAPGYRVLAERGAPHAREFEVEVSSGGRVLGTGSGRSKREAEQAAAERALGASGA